MAHPEDKALVWLKGRSENAPASLEAGFLLRQLQQGQVLRPMPTIGTHCYELRVTDRDHAWRIVYYVDVDAIVILGVFSKKTNTTPGQTIEICRKRLAAYRSAMSDKEKP